MIIMRSIYALSMAFSFPITFYIVRHCLFVFFNSLSKDKGEGHESVQNTSLSKHLLYTLPLFTITLGISLLVDSLGTVISLVGSIACINLGFVLPCMCYLKLAPFKLKFWKENRWQDAMRTLKNIAFPVILIAVGIFLAIFTTIDSLIEFYG